MNPELSPPTAFPALPVRRRETLEIFDTALKLYRRYFWVLLGWSALVSVMSLVPILQWISLFTLPLLYGAASCCVAAAVRGQSVRFRQCWQFTKPRYGALLGVVFLSWLVLIAFAMGLSIVFSLVAVAGVAALASAPQPVQIVVGVVGYILFLVVFGALGVVAFGWASMVPVVACLEDDKRGAAALGRSFELLKGNWRRVFGMSLLLGLAVLAVFGIVGGVYSVLAWDGLREIFNGAAPSESALLNLAFTVGGFMAVFFTLWNPAQSLVIAVLYLDLRVRREALDLEWTAYASAPPAPLETPSSLTATPAPRENEVAPDTAPTSFSAGGGQNGGEPDARPDEARSEL